MASDYVIPATYRQWRECIEVRCKIPLTSQFISQRLAELQDAAHPKTLEFESFYGTAHLKQTIAWFRKASEDV